VTSGRARIVVALALSLIAPACAKSVFPPGGPIDKAPPRVVATTPADSSVSVPVDGGVEFLFSESMDHASVRDAIKVFPPPAHPALDWSGRRLRLTWGEPLAANATYQVLLSGRARDAHGVSLGAPVTIRFSTGDSLARGRISGVLRAKTLRRVGARMLLFPESYGTRPDTTEFQPLYETEADTIGAYEFSALALDTGFRVFAFFDRTANGTYEEDQDVLAAWPTPIRLTPERAVADSINIVAVDPRAPAILSGTVASRDSTSRFTVEARSEADSSVARRVERTGPGPFTLRVPEGRYLLRAIRQPGPAGRPPRAEIRRPGSIDVKAEEELGGFTFEFPAGVEGAPVPSPPPDPDRPPGSEE
jgi:hypothetical protein